MDTLDSTLAALLAEHYSLDHPTLLRVLQERGGRRTLLLDSPAGKLVVKLTHTGRNENTVAAETEILAHLARHAFAAPAPVKSRDGRLYLPLGDGRFVSVYRYLEGTHPLPDDDFYTRLGELLARLHGLPTEGYNRPTSYRPTTILAAAREALSAVRDPLHQAAIDELLEIIRTFPSFDDLPTGLIHTDPWFDNLLAQPDGSLALIDWDDSGIAYPLMDVAYVVAYLCTFLPWDREKWQVPGEGLVTWRPDWAHRFLQAYHDIRPLSAAEKALFQAAVRLNFLVYIYDGESGAFIHENYRRMKIVEGFMDTVLEG